MTAKEILSEVAATLDERGQQYGDLWDAMPQILKAIWPNGVPQDLILKPEFFHFYMIVAKIIRLGNSGLTHEDSIRDILGYGTIFFQLLKHERKGGKMEEIKAKHSIKHSSQHTTSEIAARQAEEWPAWEKPEQEDKEPDGPIYGVIVNEEY